MAQKYGLSRNTSVYDPRANALMGAEYTKENKQALEAAGVKADDTSLYMSHFLGTGGGVKFMKNLQGGKGDQIAANDFRKEAASNQNIFFDKKSGRARSYKEIHSMLSTRMNQFGKDRMEALAAGKGETEVASADQRLAELKAERDTAWDKKPTTRNMNGRRDVPLSLGKKRDSGRRRSRFRLLQQPRR